jgi:hypothetical protein
MSHESTVDTRDDLFSLESDHVEPVRQAAITATFTNQGLSFHGCGQVNLSTLYQTADGNASSLVDLTSTVLHEEHDEQQIVLQLPSGQKASKAYIFVYK